MTGNDIRAALKRIRPKYAELERRKGLRRRDTLMGITRQELADRLKINVRTLDHWLAGKGGPNRYAADEIEGWANKEDTA